MRRRFLSFTDVLRAAPAAEAGRIKEAVRRVGEKVALKGLCVIDKLSPGGGKNFFCK